MKIDAYLAERADLVEGALQRWAAEAEPRVEPRLLEAMCYSLLSGGKRLRPVLLLASGEAAGEGGARLVPFACAVEMIHTYSLIHDDLPAMDDDELRRGRPSNHVVFGEGIAILAGDALLTEAFAEMSRGGAHGGFPPAEVLAAIEELATAAGAQGMVGGQTADLLAEGAKVDRARVESIHRRKTGALFRAAVRIGAMLGGADASSLERLTRFAERIGLAFQVADDLLDEAGNLAATGKSGRRDRERQKSTVPAVLGVAAARRLLEELLAAALEDLAPLGTRAEPLRALAGTVVARALSPS